MSLSGKIAIITGAAHGIGLACARRFAREGAKVVLADVDDEAGLEAEAEIQAKGGFAKYVYCDVAEKLDIHNVVAVALDAYDRIDVLLNNAGIAIPAPFFSLQEADFDKVMDVNVRGPLLCSQAVARQFVRQIEAENQVGRNVLRPYSIINMSSVDAIVAMEGQIAESVSKGALNQLTRALAVALAPYGVRVNAIGPGSIQTGPASEPELFDGADRGDALKRTPLGRLGGPEEIAAIAAFLASDDASYITGQCIYADGGRLALNYMTSKS
ncbi:MAG: SDR family oxidoreductase [Alphaproteobacteria bacterium]|nr:SDR family oxidoreductase [Alphaproteobacteria bacterium]